MMPNLLHLLRSTSRRLQGELKVFGAIESIMALTFEICGKKIQNQCSKGRIIFFSPEGKFTGCFMMIRHKSSVRPEDRGWNDKNALLAKKGLESKFWRLNNFPTLPRRITRDPMEIRSFLPKKFKMVQKPPIKLQNSSFG